MATERESGPRENAPRTPRTPPATSATSSPRPADAPGIPGPPAAPDAADRLNLLAGGFMEAKILLAGVELGIFDHLDRDRGATADEAAVAVAGDPRGVEILLDALAAIEVVQKRDGRYRNRAEYADLLRTDRGGHFAWMLRHRNRVFRNWALLEDRITGRAPVTDDDRAILSDPRQNESFIRAMYVGGSKMAPALIDAIDLDGVRVAADLGGGPGHYLAEMARRSPELEPWLIDLPLTLEVARRVQAGSGVAARIRYLTWDFFAEPPPDGLPQLDLVLISAVLHAEGPDENRTLLQKLAPFLSPGGRIVVQENTVEEDRSRPREGALFAVNMLAGTPRGRTYTPGEIRAWGAEAGLEFVSERRLTPRHFLVEMRRPA